MKFELTGAGIAGDSLRVIAENGTEVVEVFKHFNLLNSDSPDSLPAMAKAIQDGAYTHESAPKKRFWYGVDVYLDQKSLEPYRKLLKYCTGYDGNLPDMDLTALHPRRLCATHITDTAEITDGMYHTHVYIQAEEWNGQSAEVRAERNAEDYTQDDIGKRKWEREFIRSGNGQFVENPNYGRKHHRAEPGLGAPWLWDAIFAWWRSNHASEAQREVLEAVDKLRSGSRLSDSEYSIRKGGGDEASLVGYSLYALDPVGTCDWDGKGTKARVYSWEDFRNLSVPVAR